MKALSAAEFVLSKNPLIVSAESLFLAEFVNDSLSWIFESRLLTKFS